MRREKPVCWLAEVQEQSDDRRKDTTFTARELPSESRKLLGSTSFIATTATRQKRERERDTGDFGGGSLSLFPPHFSFQT